MLDRDSRARQCLLETQHVPSRAELARRGRADRVVYMAHASLRRTDRALLLLPSLTPNSRALPLNLDQRFFFRAAEKKKLGFFFSRPEKITFGLALKGRGTGVRG